MAEVEAGGRESEPDNEPQHLLPIYLKFYSGSIIMSLDVLTQFISKTASLKP